DLAAPNLERDPVEGGEAAEALGQVADREQGGRARARWLRRGHSSAAGGERRGGRKQDGRVRHGDDPRPHVPELPVDDLVHRGPAAPPGPPPPRPPACCPPGGCRPPAPPGRGPPAPPRRTSGRPWAPRRSAGSTCC